MNAITTTKKPSAKPTPLTIQAYPCVILHVKNPKGYTPDQARDTVIKAIKKFPVSEKMIIVHDNSFENLETNFVAKVTDIFTGNENMTTLVYYYQSEEPGFIDIALLSYDPDFVELVGKILEAIGLELADAVIIM